jgi:hypothetical protein
MKRSGPERMEVPLFLQKILGRRTLKISAPNREIVPLQNKLGALLSRAWPDGSKRDISWLTVDLAALWEVSRIHIILVRRLLRMGRRFNRAEMQDISQELYVNWCSNAAGHLETFERELARFKASLYRENGRKRHRRRT